jgi:hypothetical protein
VELLETDVAVSLEKYRCKQQTALVMGSLKRVNCSEVCCFLYISFISLYFFLLLLLLLPLPSSISFLFLFSHCTHFRLKQVLNVGHISAVLMIHFIAHVQ